MVTENVTISFVEKGARVVKRKIDEIGQSANNATRGIFLMQRALFVLGGAGAIVGLTKMTDALTNMENRLRLTSSSTANLEAVQNELFKAANRARSSVEATGDIYTRVALSARNLGASQQQVIAVTETLQKASILSGASAQEANAALIQLGQGLASDRLSGDELRSVLEQLPYVADIIVDYLNKTNQFGTVTRGNLRKLGKEGKLTADIVFKAIESSQTSVDKLFAETNPTIEQALNVARNNLLKYIDDVDDATGASATLANALISMSKNIEDIIGVLGLVAVAFATAFGRSVLVYLSSQVAMLTRAGAAIGRYAAIQVASASSQVTATAAVVADSTARLNNMRLRQVAIAESLRSAQVEYAESVAVFQNGRARSLTTGAFISVAAARDRLTAATIRLTAAEAANNIAKATNTRLTTASAAADVAATGARTRLAGAMAFQGAMMTRLAAMFPFLAGVVRVAAGAISVLVSALVANPIGAFIAAILAATVGLFFFGNKIKVTQDGILGLKDVAVAAFQVLGEAIGKIAGPAWDAVGQASEKAFNYVIEGVSNMAAKLGEGVINMINAITFLPRVFVGVIAGIIAAFDSLPGAAGTVAKSLANNLIAGFEAFANAAVDAINKVIEALNTMLSMLGADAALELFGLKGQIDLIDPVKLNRYAGVSADAGKTVGEAFKKGFDSVYEGGKLLNVVDGLAEALRPVGDKIMTKAWENYQDKTKLGDLEDLGNGTPPGSGNGSGGKGNSKDFAALLAELEKAIQLEKQYGIQKAISSEILKFEKTLKRDLTVIEKEQVSAAVQLIEISKKYGSVLQEIKGPAEDLKFGQAALNLLFRDGEITLTTYIDKLRELEIAAGRASNTIGGGFNASIKSAILSTREIGSALGDIVVSAADKASDAIVEFAKTGKFSIQDFFGDLFAQLIKLASKQIFLQLLSSMFGSIGGGAGGGGLKSFLGMSTGGSILPSGPGSTDSQLVAFAKRPDERVDVLTPGQQRAGSQSGSNVQINIVNNNGSQVTQERRTGPDQREIIDIAINESISRGRQDTALNGRLGTSTQRVRR